ncbi:MAG: potassium channel family protein [Ornithinimicrobium sp.]
MARRLPPLFDDTSHYVDRFGLLLAFTVATVVLLSLLDLSEPLRDPAAEAGSLVASVLVGATMMLAMRAAGVARFWQRAADAIITVGVLLLVVLVVLNLGPTVSSRPGRLTTAPLAVLVLSILAPVVTVRRLVQHRVVTVGTLLGAVSAYLLIPIAFFYIFLTMNDLQAGHFFGTREPTTSYMYFALSTVTTVGYGDLAPVAEGHRLLANSLAVIGQIYLVTFVAMLVSLFIRDHDTRIKKLEET